MKRSYKKICFVFVILLLFIISACGDQNASSDNGSDTEKDTCSFPEKDINGIIQWGEGVATDNISRILASMVEEEIGGSLVMQNREGASGAIGAQYVYDQKADGYSLLFGAENPNLYQILSISERDYLTDFKP